MNENFESIRKDLKNYNAEENSVPPKLVLAGKNDFLDIEHKRAGNSQFIIGIREFYEGDKFLIDKMIRDIEKTAGRKPLAYRYDDKGILDTVIEDFKDYYNLPLNNDICERVGSGTGRSQFILIIVISELYYYKL